MQIGLYVADLQRFPFFLASIRHVGLWLKWHFAIHTFPRLSFFYLCTKLGLKIFFLAQDIFNKMKSADTLNLLRLSFWIHLTSVSVVYMCTLNLAQIGQYTQLIYNLFIFSSIYHPSPSWICNDRCQNQIFVENGELFIRRLYSTHPLI